MKSRKSQVKYVLKGIENYPTKQNTKQTQVKVCLQNKVERLQIENRVLAQQLSQQIRNRQTLTLLLAEQKRKYDQAFQTINKMNKTEAQPLTRMVSYERLKYLKYSNSNKKPSIHLDTDIQSRKLRERIKVLQVQLLQLKSKNEKDGLIIKQLKEEFLFSRQHLKRAQQQKNELQQEMEQVRNQICQANQLMAKQNKQILNMKFQLQRKKQSEIAQKLDLAPSYLQDLEEFQQQIKQILQSNVKDQNLRETVYRQATDAVKYLEFALLNGVNKYEI